MGSPCGRWQCSYVMIAKKWQQQCPQSAHFNDGYTPLPSLKGVGVKWQIKCKQLMFH